MECMIQLVTSQVPLNMDVTCMLTHKKKSYQLQCHIKKLFPFTNMRKPFWCCGIPTEIPQNPFYDWWHMFNAFPSKYAVVFCTNHRQNRTHKFNTEGFLPDASMCGVVGSLSWFTKVLIGRIRNMFWVVYIHAKCIYSYETCAYTIIECAIVNKVQHITSTCTFISWWSDASKVRHTTRTEILSWNSFEVNCVLESVWILSKFHQPN